MMGLQNHYPLARIFRFRQIFAVSDFCCIQKAHAVDCGLVASVLLGIVKCLVSFFEDVVRGHALDVVHETAAHAYRDAQFLVFFVKDYFVYRNPYALGNSKKTFAVTFRKQNRKFLAAESCDTIIFPHQFFEGLCKDDKNFVTAQMSVGVIEMLEKIYVDYEHPGKTVEPPHVADCLSHFGDEKIIRKKPGFRFGYANLIVETVLHGHGKYGKHSMYIEHFVCGKSTSVFFLAYVR